MLDGMTNIKAREVLKEIKYYTEDLPPYSPDEVAEALEMAIKALKLQPCEDCISRESVIEWLKDKDIIKIKNQEENARRELAELPSVTPERPKGKWIEDTQTGFKIRCSKCGARNFGADRAYCPRCGRQMKEDNDD